MMIEEREKVDMGESAPNMLSAYGVLRLFCSTSVSARQLLGFNIQSVMSFIEFMNRSHLRAFQMARRIQVTRTSELCWL
jgi:hypothetical protein